MAEAIEEVKSRLSRQFLGRSGVHGIGIGSRRHVLRVYVRPQAGTNIEVLHEELARAAAPYKVVLVEDEAPSMT